MRIFAYVFYGLAAIGLLIVVTFSVGFANEYGWDWSATSLLGLLMWVALLVGVPFWIGTMFHRKARAERPVPE